MTLQKKSRGFEKIRIDPLIMNEERNTYVLAIGINNYLNSHWSKLNNASKDAQELTRVLREKFSVHEKHITLLLDEEATRVSILEKLELYEKNLKATDNLIIYFSGHGAMDEKQTRGYWVPVDAEEKLHQYIPNSTIIDHLKGMLAHHIYIIADACFAGAMILKSGQRGKDNHPSRRVFTSGELEVVYDGTPGGTSPFTSAVIDFLDKQEESFLCSSMENYVITHMQGSKPLRNILIDKEYAKGELVFHPVNSKMKKLKTAWKKALKEDTERSYDHFIQTYPNSEFAVEAEEKLEFTGERRIWFNAKRKNTIFSLRRFLDDNPDSPFRKDAQMALQRLRGIEVKFPIQDKSISINSIEMIEIEGGTFQMAEDYTVELTSYQIGKYPVTQKLWEDIMGYNPSTFKGNENLPVETISWEEAKEFIKKLNKKYPDANYSLPTEAQWEFAARGGIKSKGFRYSGSDDLNDVGWFWQNSGDTRLTGITSYTKNAHNRCRTHVPGMKAPNELGIFDMSGNIDEFCQDYFSPYPSGMSLNPTGPIKNSGQGRVVRGGGFGDAEKHCRVSTRYSNILNEKSHMQGFRIIRIV